MSRLGSRTRRSRIRSRTFCCFELFRIGVVGVIACLQQLLPDSLSSRQAIGRGKALDQLVLCFTHRLPSRVNHQVRG
jgi:hypothetical protein